MVSARSVDLEPADLRLEERLEKSGQAQTEECQTSTSLFSPLPAAAIDCLNRPWADGQADTDLRTNTQEMMRKEKRRGAATASF